MDDPRVADHLVPNRISRNLKTCEKVMGEKRFGIRDLQKSLTAQIQRI